MGAIGEIYGSPEVIENALMKKLDTFPAISNNDPDKLRDLSDLLKELESAKAEGFLPGLMYLDTARGVNPIPSDFGNAGSHKGSNTKRIIRSLYHQSAFLLTL